MPGLIDQSGDTGLAFTVGGGLQVQAAIGGGSLIVQPLPSWLPVIDGIVPSMAANFENGELWIGSGLVVMDDYIPCVRSTPGYAQTLAGQLVLFPANAMRRTDKGMLSEPAATNVLLQSQNISTSWTVSQMLAFGSGSVVDATAAPDGTVTADLVVPNTVSTGHFIRQAVTATVAQTWTYTHYIKPAGYSRYQLTLFDTAATSNLVSAVFNLDLGTITSLANGGLGTGATASTETLANGWYRLTLTGQPNTSGTSISAQARQLNNSGTSTFAGDGVSGSYYWGAQLETGSAATSYIATTTTSQPRSADAMSMTGTNFSSWYNQTEGTFFLDAIERYTSKYYWSASDNSISNRIIRLTSSSTVPQMQMTVGGATQASIAIGSALTQDTNTKTAVGYKTNNTNMALNGVLGTLDTSCSVPTVDRLYVAANHVGATQPINYSRLLYYLNTRITDAQLQAATT